MAGTARNPIKRIRQEGQRDHVQQTTGRVVFGLGPAGEGGQFAAAEIDTQGNIVECAVFDDGECDGGFDIDTFCD